MRDINLLDEKQQCEAVFVGSTKVLETIDQNIWSDQLHMACLTHNLLAELKTVLTDVLKSNP